jgi:polysaccharide export outer membrane protein
MHRFSQRLGSRLLVFLASLVVLTSGCASWENGREKVPETPFPNDTPRELRKVSLPDYVIEPPDILIVNVLNAFPKAPYRVREGDVLRIEVSGVLPQRPIAGNFSIESGGALNLGEPYGYIQVARMTMQEVIEAITAHLKSQFRNPVASVSLAQYAALQQVAGEHHVGLDGDIMLGTYGEVRVCGLTRTEAKRVIEGHLTNYLESPEVSVDIYAYNSKVYYVFLQGTGPGDGVARFPITGNETVLDAMSQVQGLQPYSSKRIWVARPAPAGNECAQILPVDWEGVTQRADTRTNYQLLPGDRLYVAEDKAFAATAFINKIVSPFERAFGFVMMGTGMAKQINFFNNANSNY